MEDHHLKRVVALTLIVALLIGGTVFYSYVEGWSFVDSFYFTGMTLTTVGYGDFVPSHNFSKIMTVFFALAGVGIFLYAMTTIAQEYFTDKETRFLKKKNRLLKEIKKKR
ncbi:MAG: two pore domain potassium channel family protein [Nanoarchaeota archaeon]|nr:two pore domain potassium channel family protein [Nanoarchaeota archaeon]